MLAAAAVAAAFAWFGGPTTVAATGLPILDFTEWNGKAATGSVAFCDTSQSCGSSHIQEGFTWIPKANTEVCEVYAPLQRNTGTAGTGTIDMAIYASPSGDLLAESDAQIPGTSIGDTYLEQFFEFRGDAQPGQSCYLMQAGQKYYFHLRMQVGSAVGWSVNTKYWQDYANISASTWRSWRTATNAYVSQQTSPGVYGEVAWRANGFGPFTGEFGPGSSEYEAAVVGEYNWVTHEDYFQGAASDSELGFFGDMLRDVFVFLFVPIPRVQDEFQDLRDDIEGRVPFSYFAEIASMADAGVAASGSVPVVELTVPVTGASISMFSSSRIEELAPSGFLDALRALAEVGLWLAFAWFVWTTLHRMFST